ncbi:pyridoxamine 5'-phosphate oxidase family protein [Agromyces sp. NPDC058484]|uniref:pyridoxamine 5'-phosphate oxidase family protein n=1 Tax=Agromyces sp. NPDC058484 TaxID=3346524 RepID=UPI003668A68F
MPPPYRFLAPLRPRPTCRTAHLGRRAGSGQPIDPAGRRNPCAVVYGVLEPIDDERADAALLALSERLMPGRAAEVRAMTRKEVAATRVLRLALDDVVMKSRAAGASEDQGDGEDHTVWAGVVPLGRTWGAPEPSPLTPAGTPTPDSVVALTTRSRAEHRLH